MRSTFCHPSHDRAFRSTAKARVGPSSSTVITSRRIVTHAVTTITRTKDLPPFLSDVETVNGASPLEQTTKHEIETDPILEDPLVQAYILEHQTREAVTRVLNDDEGFAEPMLVHSLWDLVQLTLHHSTHKRQKALANGPERWYRVLLVKTADKVAKRLLQEQVPWRLLRSIHASLRLSYSSLPDGWVSDEDGSIDLGKLDECIDALQSWPSSYEDLAYTLHRLRRVVAAGSVERQLQELQRPFGAGLMCAIAAALPQLYLQPGPPQDTNSRSAHMTFGTGVLHPLTRLPPYQLHLCMRGRWHLMTPRYTCVDMAEMNMMMQPRGGACYMKQVAQLRVNLALVRWLVQVCLGESQVAKVHLLGRLYVSKAAIDAVYQSLEWQHQRRLLEEVAEEWGFELWVLCVV